MRLWCLIARDCCCLFNPLYSFAEERNAGDGGDDDAEEMMGRARGRYLDEDGAATASGLYEGARPILYQLPEDWDGWLEYLKVFDRLDKVALEEIITQQPAERSYSAANSHYFSEARINETLSYLTLAHPGTVEARELNRAFNLLRMAIAQTAQVSAERERLVRAYEKQRAVHSLDDQVQNQSALWWLEEARNERQPPQDRVLYYQKSLYYTHRPSEKQTIRREYDEYCATLMRRPSRRDSARARGKSV